MKPNQREPAGSKGKRRWRSDRNRCERGVALIIALLLLTLLSAASVAMVLSVSSDTMINGYYRNYRGSFYAADSGINVVVETMKNAIYTNATDGSNPPLNTATIGSQVSTTLSPFSSYYVIGDTGSWKSQFRLMNAGSVLSGTPLCTSSANPNDGASPGDNDLLWQCTFNYTVTVQGQALGTEAEEITETGMIVYNSTSGSPSTSKPPSFSKWGAYITNFAECQGPLVPGTMTGPFFTNGQWNFGDDSNPGYTFVNSVGQVDTQVSWYDSSGKCHEAATAPSGQKVPNFESGMTMGDLAVTAPTDTYSQAQAVLDGKGDPPCYATPCPTESGPTQAQMSQELATLPSTGQPVTYPSTGTASTGVYIPYYTSGTSPSGVACTSAKPCYGSSTAQGYSGYAGGFYVQGNAQITLSATSGCSNTSACGSSDPTQTYSIVQGSTTTNIVVDDTTGVTVVNGNVLSGVPTQVDPNSGAVITQTDPSGSTVYPTLVYVNGSITGLTGTYNSQSTALAAVQNNVGITIATSASNNISITGDLTYASSPVNTPADTLVSNTNAGVLGIYTSGNINLYPDPSGNLTVDASLAALSGNTGSSATSGFETPGKSINTWTILGGRCEDQAHSVSINSGITYFDQRFANNFGPPWFPTAQPQAGNPYIPSAQGITVTRSLWQEVNRP